MLYNWWFYLYHKINIIIKSQKNQLIGVLTQIENVMARRTIVELGYGGAYVNRKGRPSWLVALNKAFF